ncbi:hypothetical protein, partial [Acidithiobacillus ferriphilus]|uniref:hypothetical protein n=1 Tax=Acidithiobacillus ferriphilus TaxID=1689834 RepID=UPI001C06A330
GVVSENGKQSTLREPHSPTGDESLPVCRRDADNDDRQLEVREGVCSRNGKNRTLSAAANIELTGKSGKIGAIVIGE